MKRYILQRMSDDLYCCQTTKENGGEAFTPDISKATLYNKTETTRRIYGTKDKYILITILIDR